MAGPRKPPGSDWDPTLDDAEIFIETPTVRSDIGPLPDSDELHATMANASGNENARMRIVMMSLEVCGGGPVP